MVTKSPIEREAERVALVASMAVTPEREARYNSLIDLAAFVAHTPMASLTIVDAHEAWFKATVGFESPPIDRADAICGRTVGSTKPLVIPDTREHEDFRDNPLVTGPMGVRFYAGFPLLIHDDLAVGTVCVMDRRPRTLLSDERNALQTIADQVATQLRVTRLEGLLRDQAEG